MRNPSTNSDLTNSDLTAFLDRTAATVFGRGSAWIRAAAPWTAYVRRSQRLVVGPELVWCLDLANTSFDPHLDSHTDKVVKWGGSAVTRGYAMVVWMRWVKGAEEVAREHGLGAVYVENVLNPSFKLIYFRLGYRAVPGAVPLSLYKELV